MDTTLLRIDPALPLCWEDEHTLRLGFDRAEARLHRPTAATQRLVGALSDGVRSDRITQTIRRLGATRTDWQQVLAQLGPTLRREPYLTPSSSGTAAAATMTPVRRVGVIGAGMPAHSLQQALGRAGFVTVPFTVPDAGARIEEGAAKAAAEDTSPPDLVVVIERFVRPSGAGVHPVAAGRPHLLIRISDRSIRVGPLVSGRGSPCLGCVILQDIDADPPLPTLAAQLFDAVPAAETAASAEAAAALATTMARHWRAGSLRGAVRIELPVYDGLPDPVPLRHKIDAHPACACALNAAGADRPP